MTFLNKKFRTLYLATLPISSVASFYIVMLNYSNDIYPTTQDTLTIPFVAMFGLLAILLFLAAIQNPLYKQLHNQKKTNTFSISLALVSTTISSALLIRTINYWLTPNHLHISLLYSITLTSYIIHQFNLYKKLISKKHN